MRWYILASGPSLAQSDVRSVRGRGIVCAVNSTIFAAPWADVLFAADTGWWKEYGRQVADLDAKKVAVWPRAKNYGATEIVECESGTGYSAERIRRGGGKGNSGYMAICYAVMQGATDIVLVGFDMAHSFGKKHWHGDHPKHMGNATNPDKWLPGFDHLARDLESIGVKVVNCSRVSRLTCFPRMTLEALHGV